MGKLVIGLIAVLAVQIVLLCPCQAQQATADIAPAQAKALTDTLLRLCEETAAIRAEILSQRQELDRMTARPWTGRKKLEKMKEKVESLDKELALKMKNFLDQYSRMTALGDWQKNPIRKGRAERPEARTTSE